MAEEYPTMQDFKSLLPGDAQTDEPKEEAPVPSTSSNMNVSSTPVTTDKITTLHTTFLNGTTRTWHAKYFLPLSHAPPPIAVDLPESYFSPTPSELQTAFAGQVKKREELTERPLLTQKLREREEAAKSRQKAARWPNTRIRIRFSDRSMLEGVFPSTDLLGAVYEFVKASLAEDCKKVPFVLYQSPPRKEYKRVDPAFKGKNLMDLQLTPSSIFYIKFETDELNEASRKPPLLPEILASATELPPPPTFDPTKQDESKDKGKAKPTNSQKLGFGGSSGKVVPSWLKVGRK